jgi:hypothetical protein
MKPDLVTQFVFNDTVVVEVSSNYIHSVMVEVRRIDDSEDEGGQFHLNPDEVDLFISTLTLYKNRLINRKK